MSASPATFDNAPLGRVPKLNGRILYFVNDAPFFLSHRLPIARAARDAGIEVHVATPSHPAVEEIRGEGFVHHAVAISRWGANPFREIASLLAIARILHRVRPDILHNVTIKPVLYGSLAARSCRSLAVVNALSGLGTVFIHNGKRASIRRFVVVWLYRRLLKRRDVYTIFQNRDDYRTFLHEEIVVDDQAVIIAGSGVDLNRFRATPLPAGKPIVVLASRMLWDKGVGEFVRAAEYLRSRGVAARFVLVGESEQGNPVSVPETQLEDWRRKDLVEWWGRREDMPKVFEQAYAVCLPSYREGLPKVLLEAAACGRPIVATDVPGCREVVRHGFNGLIVPERDSKSLANAISELLSDRSRSQAMGDNGRRIVETELNLEIVVQRTLRLYERLLR